jgi:tRNA dimethylallyltransferase
MSRTVSESPLVAILGPTGSGKSELALKVAEQLDGEVLSCDSLQVYRYFNVGTAKLQAQEMGGIPHHLIDVIEPDEEFSAGEFARRGRATLLEIAGRGKLPVVAGGTGFYLRALFEGLFPSPGRDNTTRAQLADRECRRPGSLHRLLRRFDPAAAVRIHPRDVHKLIRAVEVRLMTRRSITEAFGAGRDPLQGFRILKIGVNPPREALYQRLDERCRWMFEHGLVQEIRRILLLGYSPAVKPLESHGYRQGLQFLRGELTFEEAVLDAQRNTRRYAKRQWTWFRREPGIEWFNGFGGDPDIQDRVMARIRSNVQGSQTARAPD